MCVTRVCSSSSFFFFFNDTATTEIYTLSLHDALPISTRKMWFVYLRTSFATSEGVLMPSSAPTAPARLVGPCMHEDRKSTRLNSSHLVISYAVFCLKKKKKKKEIKYTCQSGRNRTDAD